MLFAVIMFCSLLISTSIALFSLRQLSREHTEELLSTLSKDIERSIDNELSETVSVSKTIANDTLLIRLLEEEETDMEMISERLADYTSRLENTFAYQWVFIASDKTKGYYANTGLYQILDPTTEEDSWYADFVNQGAEYNVTIGKDNDTPDTWTIFADVRIENDEGDFLGICGIALQLDDLQEMIRSYEEEYGIEVLFVDSDGVVQLTSSDVGEAATLEDFEPDSIDREELVVTRQGTRENYTITKYVEQVSWYMIINDFDPYSHTIDVYLIAFNVLSFVVMLFVTFLCLHYMVRKSRSLLAASYGDELTGMYNRRAYEDYLKELRKDGLSSNLTVIAFDVNGLKTANDSLGHNAGDELIRGASQVILEVFSPYGKCYRTGGDEFMAILDEEIADVRELTDQFELRMAQWKGSHVKKLSISYGVVSASQQTELSVDELVAMADEKMYHRKQKFYKKMRSEKKRVSK
jgi:diguanylate cyclase (GGDEF)-like protein